MRIAIVGNFGLTGNQTMASRALPIAEVLASRGHRVRLALPIRRHGDGVRVKRPGIEVVYAGRPLAGPFGYPWQVLVLVWLSLRWRPHVVYVFKPIAHSGAVLEVFRLLRLIGVFRGTIALDTDDWEGDGGWNEKQPFPGWVKRVIAWQEKRSLRNADVVTAASLELANLAERCGARRVVYLPNCLAEVPQAALKAGDPARWPGDGAGPRVLVYTRFVEYRLERLIAVLEAILARVPAATVVVAGTGLNREEEELKRLMRQGGLASHVRITAAWVGPDDKSALFGAADVALYLLDDNLLNRTKCPVKLLELTAAGVPIVVDRVGQATEYVVDGVTGLLVPSGDVEAMASAAASLLSDSEVRLRMAEAAGGEASKRWIWRSWLPDVERALGLT